MTPRDVAIGQLGHGPSTAAMLAGTLVAHDVPYLDGLRVAKEQLASLVISGHAEVIRVKNTDLYRLTAKTPMGNK